MVLEIPERYDYAYIMKYLIDYGIEAMSDLEMYQIKIIVLDFIMQEFNILPYKTVFFPEDKILDEKYKKDIENISKLTGDFLLVKCRISFLDIIINRALKLYQILKISYQRKGRTEILEKLHKYTNKYEEKEHEEVPEV